MIKEVKYFLLPLAVVTVLLAGYMENKDKQQAAADKALVVAYRAQIDQICRTFPEVAKEAGLYSKMTIACSSNSGSKKVMIDRVVESEPGTYSSTGYVIYEGGTRKRFTPEDFKK